MGSLFSKSHSVLRVIYIEDVKNARIYPLAWPNDFNELKNIVGKIFPKLKNIDIFYFQDASDFSVCVCNNETFNGLVPKYKVISPNIDLYYVTINSLVIKTKLEQKDKIT